MAAPSTAHARFVMLIDGSRSMGDHARTALTMAAALASATTRLEAFTFSTALHRVTSDVRRAAAGERGGSTTAAGLGRRDQHRRLPPRLHAALRRPDVGRDTVVLIASDGLDLGDPAMLSDVMRELHRRSAGVVWLNPLLDTAGYEPTASGMRAARPYVTTFTSIRDPAGLARLARTVKLRA